VNSRAGRSGRVLTKMGKVTQAQVIEALELQRL
jgi:hypothetical protein